MAELKAIEKRALVNVQTDVDSATLVRQTKKAVTTAQKAAGTVQVDSTFREGDLASEVKRAVQNAQRAAKNINVGTELDDVDLTSAVRASVQKAQAAAGTLDIKTRVNSRGIGAEAAAAAKAAELAAGDIDIPVRLDQKKVQKDAVTLGRTMSGIAATAVALGPALIPVAAGLSAVFLAVAAPLTAATAGLGAFAILAIPTIKNVVDASADLEAAQKKVTDAITAKERTKALTELQRLTESLSPTTLLAVEALDKVKQGFSDLRTVLQDDIMSVFNAGLAVAVAALPAIGALAKAVSPALVQVADSLAAAFNRTGVEGFVGFLTSKAASAILGFAYGLANIAKGFASMMVAFDPVSRSIGGGLDALLVKFSTIGESAGFRQFVGYVQSVGPLVVDTLGSVFRAVGALVIAFAPLGAVALVVIRGIADGINALPLPVLTALGALFVTLAIVAGAANLVLGIQTIVFGVQAAAAVASTAATAALGVAMAVLTSPITAVIVVIAALVAGLVLAYRESETFRNIVNAAWEAVRGATVAAFNAIRTAVSAALAFIRALFNTDFAAIRAIASAALDAVRSAFVGTFATVVANVIAAFGTVRSTVSSALAAVIGFITGAMSQVRALFTDGFNGAREGVTSAVDGILGVVRGIPGQIVGALGNLGGLLFDSGRSVMSGFAEGIRSMVRVVKDAVGSVLSAARNLLPFSPAKEGPFSGRGWTTYSGAAIVDGLISGIESREAAAVRATSGLASNMSGALEVEGTVASSSTTRSATLDEVVARLDRLTVVVERMPREQQTMRRRR